MLKAKIIKKKNAKIDQLLKSLNSLSKNKVEVGHFKESGLHGLSDLTYPELLQGWAHGIFQEGVIKNPMAAFNTLMFYNKGILKNPSVNRVYKKFFNNITDINASQKFLDEMGQVLRDEYAELFGKAGYLMPVIGGNHTPLEDTGELKSAAAYKTSYNNQVKEIGIK